MRVLKKVLLILLCTAAVIAAALGIHAWSSHQNYGAAAGEIINCFSDWISGVLPWGRSGQTNSADQNLVVYSIPDREDPLVLPAWDGRTPAVSAYENQPLFSVTEKNAEMAYISYASLDELGRCGAAFAVLDSALMPEEDRQDEEDRLSVLPSGYQQERYEGWIEHDYLYNRCHLIAWQLGGDSSALNLITGTRNLNIEGMLPYENSVARYLRFHPYAHVLYRVTPVFCGTELTCRGVLMEAWSVEDHGSLSFSAFVYNEQPGIRINHQNGYSQLSEGGSECTN